MRNLSFVLVVCALACGGAAFAQENLSDSEAVGGPVGTAESQVPGDPVGVLTFYGDRATFDAANPGLPLEDWEDFTIGAGSVASCEAPANSGTSCPGVYVPGDILPGLELTDDPGPDVDGLVALGLGFNGNPSIQFGSNTFVDALVINFGPPVFAAGMDIACHFGAATVDMEIFDGGGTSMGTTTSACSNAGTFWGVSSTVTGIGSIRIFDPSAVQAETIDNVAFGGEPVPTMGDIGRLILTLLLALTGVSVLWRRRHVR